MSTQAAIVLADGQTTPVNRTFSPRGANGKLAVYKDISGGTAAAFPVLTIATTESPSPNGARNIKLRLTIPVMEVPAGGTQNGYQASPRVAFNVFGKVELTLPNRASVQNVKDIHAFIKNLLGHSVVTETVVNNDPPY